MRRHWLHPVPLVAAVLEGDRARHPTVGGTGVRRAAASTIDLTPGRRRCAATPAGVPASRCAAPCGRDGSSGESVRRAAHGNVLSPTRITRMPEILDAAALVARPRVRRHGPRRRADRPPPSRPPRNRTRGIGLRHRTLERKPLPWSASRTGLELSDMSDASCERPDARGRGGCAVLIRGVARHGARPSLDQATTRRAPALRLHTGDAHARRRDQPPDGDRGHRRVVPGGVDAHAWPSSPCCGGLRRRTGSTPSTPTSLRAWPRACTPNAVCGGTACCASCVQTERARDTMWR